MKINIHMNKLVNYFALAKPSMLSLMVSHNALSIQKCCLHTTHEDNNSRNVKEQIRQKWSSTNYSRNVYNNNNNNSSDNYYYTSVYNVSNVEEKSFEETQYPPLTLDAPFSLVQGEEEVKQRFNLSRENLYKEEQEEEEEEEYEEEVSNKNNNAGNENAKEIIYCCAQCQTPLFSSQHFASTSSNAIHRSGWPSFTQPIQNYSKVITLRSWSQKSVVMPQQTTNTSEAFLQHNNTFNNKCHTTNIRNNSIINNYNHNYNSKNALENLHNTNNCKWKIASRSNEQMLHRTSHDSVLHNLSKELQQYIPQTSLAFRGEAIEHDTIHPVGKSIKLLKPQTARERSIRSGLRRSDKLIQEGCCAKCHIPICRVVYHTLYVPTELSNTRYTSKQHHEKNYEDEYNSRQEEEDIGMEDAKNAKFAWSSKREDVITNASGSNTNRDVNNREANEPSVKVKAKHTRSMRKVKQMCFVVSPSRVYATLELAVKKINQ